MCSYGEKGAYLNVVLSSDCQVILELNINTDKHSHLTEEVNMGHFAASNFSQ